MLKIFRSISSSFKILRKIFENLMFREANKSYFTFEEKTAVGTIFGPYDMYSSYYCPKANADKQDLEVVQQRAMQYIITKTNVYIHL